jgi:hypothetical protein
MKGRCTALALHHRLQVFWMILLDHCCTRCVLWSAICNQSAIFLVGGIVFQALLYVVGIAGSVYHCCCLMVPLHGSAQPADEQVVVVYCLFVGRGLLLDIGTHLPTTCTHVL